MRGMRLFRLLPLLTLLLGPAALGFAARTPANPDPATTSLAGQLLVASPDMPDPRFRRTVILLVRHDKTGAMGIVINRPLGEEPLAKLLGEIGRPVPGAQGSVRIFAGGPMQPYVGLILHSPEYRRAQTVTVDRFVAMTSDPELLRDIARHHGPAKTLVAFGYAGWGPGQLENELTRHGWFTIPDDPKLLFDEDRAQVWDKAKARRTFPL
jgi:putative transcriptional regulator